MPLEASPLRVGKGGESSRCVFEQRLVLVSARGTEQADGYGTAGTVDRQTGRDDGTAGKQGEYGDLQRWVIRLEWFARCVRALE